MIKGKVILIKNSLVDVAFYDLDKLPKIHDIVYIKKDNSSNNIDYNNDVILECKNINEFGISQCEILHNDIKVKNGDEVLSTQCPLSIYVGDSLRGRLLNPLGMPIDGKGEIKPSKIKKSIHGTTTSQHLSKHDVNFKIAETGIKIIDLFCPYVLGSKIGIIGGAGVGKSILMMELINNAYKNNTNKQYAVFAGVGERQREGRSLYEDLEQSKIINKNNLKESKITLVYGNMDASSGLRQKAAQLAVTIAEYFRNNGEDVLLFIDNFFRFLQAGNEIFANSGKIPIELGYQCTLHSETAALQERIFSSNKGSITCIQAIYVPADDKQDPAVLAIEHHCSGIIVLDRDIANAKLYPAVCPLQTNSDYLKSNIVGFYHYNAVLKTRHYLVEYDKLKKIIEIMGLESLTDRDKLIYSRALKIRNYLTQPMFSAEYFTNIAGVLVDKLTMLNDVHAICDGKYDNIHEKYFLNIGSLNTITFK